MVTAGGRWGPLGRVLEVLAILAAPGAFYAVLRLRGMAPVQLPDPSMHTTFIIDPRDIFTRYAAVFTPTARLREAARVGFLVPGRTAYLLFGAVGGFFVLRYVLALVAIVPLYVLLKRLYGRWAGFAALAVVMASPVFVTSWGTDYPDSAAISYLTGALCALAMPAPARRRPYWLFLAAALLTLAVWSHGAAMPLGAAALLAYAVVRLLRSRDHLVRDAAVLVATFAAVTGLLAVCSFFLLGQANFLTPTWQAFRYLDTPAQEAIWHSANWHWVLYDPWLLVPPAALAAFAAVFARRLRNVPTPQLFVGLASLVAFAGATLLQFAGNVQMLEMAYFSSMIWAFVALLLALAFAELATAAVGWAGARRRHRSSTGHLLVMAPVKRAARQCLPLLLLVAIPLAYEADPNVPAMRLDGWGAVVAAIAVGAALLWRLVDRVSAHGGQRRRWSGVVRVTVALAVFVVLVGASLVLTVAPEPPHAPLRHVAIEPPSAPAYAAALGGSDTLLVDEYQVTAEVPGFVGHAAYPGEQLLTWWPHDETGELIGPIGIFHSGYNAINPRAFPELIPAARARIEFRRPAQVLLMSVTGAGFPQALRSMARFSPVVVHRGVLSDGTFHLHLWLLDLGRYFHRARR